MDGEHLRHKLRGDIERSVDHDVVRLHKDRGVVGSSEKEGST